MRIWRKHYTTSDLKKKAEFLLFLSMCCVLQASRKTQSRKSHSSWPRCGSLIRKSKRSITVFPDRLWHVRWRMSVIWWQHRTGNIGTYLESMNWVKTYFCFITSGSEGTPQLMWWFTHLLLWQYQCDFPNVNCRRPLPGGFYGRIKTQGFHSSKIVNCFFFPALLWFVLSVSFPSCLYILIGWLADSLLSLKFGLYTCRISSTWELVKSVSSRVPHQTHRIR